MKQKYINRLAVFAVFLIINTVLYAENPDSILLNISFGQQDRTRSTSSLSNVSGEDLRKSHAATLSNTFFGRFSGMTTIQTDAGL